MTRPDRYSPQSSSLPFLTALTAVFCALQVAKAATLSWFAGTGSPGSDGDGGPALAARFNAPFGILRAADGSVWVCEYQGHVVRRISPDGTVETVAGTGTAGWTGDGGPATRATLNHPHEIRFDRRGNLFIADTSNHVIRRIDGQTRFITTVAGTGKPGYSGDNGPATNAALHLPISLQISPSGDLFIGDIGNHVIRKVETDSGRIVTLAGTGRLGPPPDGAPLTGTPLNGPRSVDMDRSGDLWVVTREGNQVLRFDVGQRLIHHVAGTGEKGYGGDGGPAKTALLNGPKAIVAAPDGSILVADTENHVIRRIHPKSGSIERIAGTGKRGTGPVGEPQLSALSQPHALWLDTDGSLLISDSMNHRILMLRPK